ncbi:putative vacuolar ATP synthase subunit F [Ostreococcus tauri]|jgi:V-type H+-transporting ATPase subunit F|uniref:V-type proton ATPase subunit F n=1 Tax=Ostreococcus tauri TaxID=70448 RepID=A0A1Y5IQS8_OSTTA|nr:putative vacuolar ATP synthase subunit F [Ostreococcus tauri]
MCRGARVAAGALHDARRRGARVMNEDGDLVAVIGDEDTVTGFLLAGVGHVDERQRLNYLVVGERTTDDEIADAFKAFTATREDVAVVLITQVIADRIRHLVDAHSRAIPSVLEIPDKENPYRPESDSVLSRVRHLLGGDGT